MTDYRPAEIFAPGEFIRGELEARGWTQADLADIVGRPPSLISAIVSGARAISPDIANELGEAFGTSAEYWLRHESTYRLSLAQNPSGAVQRKARLYDLAPVKAMQKRQWIPKANTTAELEDSLMRFYATQSPDDVPSAIRVAARATGAATVLTPPQYTWCRQALRLASSLHTPPYRQSAIRDGLPQLRALMADPEEARKVPRVLAEMGVRFLLIEPLPDSHIDGAALWLPDNSPLVAVSTRFDRIDSFWFTLCHELAHIETEDQQGSLDRGALDTDLMDKRPDILEEAERRADQRASDMLIPQEVLSDFIVRKRPYFYRDYIIQFANKVGVHPGIVVGQLQYRGEIGYYANRAMLVKIRKVVASEALTDGWGYPGLAL